MTLHPEARHHARRAINYLAEAYDLDDVAALDDGYLDLGPKTVVVLRLNTPSDCGARIRLEDGHYHLEACHGDGPWLPVLHRFSQKRLERIFVAVAAIDQDKTMGQPPRKGEQ